MLMPFTSDVIMLAVGFAVGYWLLMSAGRYESKMNKTGEMLGWILIASTVFFTVCNFLFAFSIMNEKQYTPVNGPNGPVGQSVINEDEPDNATSIPARPSAAPTPSAPPQQGVPSGPVGGGHPIKNEGSGPMGGD